jgi:hypothetical protein
MSTRSKLHRGRSPAELGLNPPLGNTDDRNRGKDSPAGSAGDRFIRAVHRFERLRRMGGRGSQPGVAGEGEGVVER